MRYAHKGDRLADVAASLMVALVARTPLPLDAAWNGDSTGGSVVSIADIEWKEY